MVEGKTFDLEADFAGIDFNSKRLEDRFRRTVKTLAKQPGESIWRCSANRAESKAIYNMLGNERFDQAEILREHHGATVKRLAGEPLILAVQDTTSLNYDTHEKTEGIGYIGDKAKGVNIHSCIAVTPEGLVLGVLDQMHYNRPEAKDASMTEQEKRRRPIKEKESNRWLTTMGNAEADVPADVKLVHVCDREGDMYELFNEAAQNDRLFLIRVVQNRMTVENERILDEIQKRPCAGHINTVIPRDSRRGLKERETVLEVRYASFEIKKPYVQSANKTLLPSIRAQVIYVKEEKPPEGIEPIAWFLMTNEAVGSGEEAYEKVGYYIQRWKIERFHFVLKDGCRVEKLQERSIEKTTSLVLLYSIISVFIMNLTYIARLNPELPCTILFDDEEWKLLYCAANRTKKAPEKPYTIAEAVKYVGWLGGPRTAPSDGPPGVKTIWKGLQKLYTLLDYRELFDFVGQV